MSERELQQAAELVRLRSRLPCFDLAVILGSGLGGVADLGELQGRIPYEELPGLPRLRVAGHQGRLTAAVCGGLRVLFFQGRFHCYQGLSAREASLPVTLAHLLGCRRLLLTNASGGVGPNYTPGDFMYVRDHVNLLGDNPLRGMTEDPFLDLSDLYQQRFFPRLQDTAIRHGFTLHQGVLCAMPGPSYETPAEIRLLRSWGVDAVSMSTVPEAIMGSYLGMEVVALSFIANPAAGLSPQKLNHLEVLAAAGTAETHLTHLLQTLLDDWGAQGDG